MRAIWPAVLAVLLSAGGSMLLLAVAAIIAGLGGKPIVQLPLLMYLAGGLAAVAGLVLVIMKRAARRVVLHVAGGLQVTAVIALWAITGAYESMIFFVPAALGYWAAYAPLEASDGRR